MPKPSFNTQFIPAAAAAEAFCSNLPKENQFTLGKKVTNIHFKICVKYTCIYLYC